MNKKQVIYFLENHADESYKNFCSKLTPTNDKIYGVKVPILRTFAKEIAKTEAKEFLNLPKDSFEEKCLHGFVLGYAKLDFEEFVLQIKKFSLLIDNWAVCDTACSTFKIIKKHKDEFLPIIKNLLEGEDFQVRFALVLLLDYYVEDNYVDYIFSVCDSVERQNYYVKMAVAWLISVCYVKQRQKTDEYLKRAKLDKFTFNIALQKIRESFRVSQEDKQKLKEMKVK